MKMIIKITLIIFFVILFVVGGIIHQQNKTKKIKIERDTEVLSWEDSENIYYSHSDKVPYLIIEKDSGNVGIGDIRTKEEIEEDKKRDSREGVVEYKDNEGVVWKYINIFYDESQPITIWENQDTKERVEMFGYLAPSGRLEVRMK